MITPKDKLTAVRSGGKGIDGEKLTLKAMLIRRNMNCKRHISLKVEKQIIRLSYLTI